MQHKLRFGRLLRAGRRGQSLTESCIAIALICVVFIGALQISQIFAAREVLYRAAAAGARARTVGLNDFMVHKVVKVACIPIAGTMITPDDVENAGVTDSLGYTSATSAGDIWENVLGAGMPPSELFNIEESRITSFLGSYYWIRAEQILNYSDWDTVESSPPDSDLTLINMNVAQGYTNWLALPRTFFASDRLDLEGEWQIENHYSLYMDDSYAGGW